MRRPFLMEDLRPDDQRTARRWFFGILLACTAIVLLGFGIMVVRSERLDNANARCAARHAGSGDCRQGSKVVLPGRSRASS
jgi:hypothetical protein